MKSIVSAALALSLSLNVLSAFARSIDGEAPGIPETIDAAPVLPQEFAFTFSLPYGLGDEFPREPEEFDRMLGLLKGAGFNTVHCPYADWRVPLFKKHGMKMMVDVLAWKPPVEADIRDPEQRPKVKAMCEAMRDNDAIWGYNLWNERLDWCGNFDYLDAWIRMLRTWDPTHPVWVGTYRYLYCEHYKTPPGVMAWYDYHWQRGFGWNLGMLKYYREVAAKRQCAMGKWLLLGDYNRSLYTLNTSIASGVKVVLWFIGGPYAAREPDLGKRWAEDQYLVRIGRHMQPLYGLIGRMGADNFGHPYAVYSTEVRRTASNTDQQPGIPKDCLPFPEDSWLKVKQGEVLCGLFKLPDGADAVYMANHNAYAWQGVVMEIAQDRKQPRTVELFNRAKGEWDTYGTPAVFNTSVPPADAIVFRFRTIEPKAELDTAPEPETDWNPASHFERIGKLLREKEYVEAKDAKPYAVYSTETARTASNKDKQRGLPDGTHPFPEDYWMVVKQGEMLAGVFKLKDGADAICFANHNAYAFQGGLIIPKQTEENPIVISEFLQDSGEWVELGAWGDINFEMVPKGSIVLRFKQTGGGQ